MAALEQKATPDFRFLYLQSLTAAAWYAQDFLKVNSYAQESLSLANSGLYSGHEAQLAYWANHFLGLLALRAKDLPLAEYYLLASAAAADAPLFRSIGPNMSLAKGILEMNRSSGAVLAFLDAWSKIWIEDRGQVALWRATITGGAIPAFGTARLEFRP